MEIFSSQTKKSNELNMSLLNTKFRPHAVKHELIMTDYSLAEILCRPSHCPNNELVVKSNETMDLLWLRLLVNLYNDS
jgi:hypothetical protein